MPEILKSVQKGVASAAIILIAVCLLLSAVQLFADISDSFMDILSVAVLGAATYAASYISTQLCRSKGLLQGILCGALVFAVTFLASILAREFNFTDYTVIKAAVCLLAGAFGGIKGVNTKKTNLRRRWH